MRLPSLSFHFSTKFFDFNRNSFFFHINLALRTLVKGIFKRGDLKPNVHARDVKLTTDDQLHSPQVKMRRLSLIAT